VSARSHPEVQDNEGHARSVRGTRSPPEGARPAVAGAEASDDDDDDDDPALGSCAGVGSPPEARVVRGVARGPRLAPKALARVTTTATTSATPHAEGEGSRNLVDASDPLAQSAAKP